MPQTCSICRNKRVSEIDRELILRRPFRNIAERYSVSATALFRHKQHLPEKLALAKKNQDALSAEGLLADLADLKCRLRRGLERAEKAENAPAFVAFARELRQALESYFTISERVAEKTRTPEDASAVQIEAVYQGIGPEERQRIRDLYGLDVAGLLPSDNGKDR